MCHFSRKSRRFSVATIIAFVDGSTTRMETIPKSFSLDGSRVLPMNAPHSRPLNGPKMIMIRCLDGMLIKVTNIYIGSLCVFDWVAEKGRHLLIVVVGKDTKIIHGDRLLNR